jgi:hypothetical protein
MNPSRREYVRREPRRTDGKPREGRRAGRESFNGAGGSRATWTKPDGVSERKADESIEAQAKPRTRMSKTHKTADIVPGGNRTHI